MRELILETLDKLEVQEGELRFGTSHQALKPLGQFIAKNFGEWLREDVDVLYVHYSIRNALATLGPLAMSGSLATTLDQAQREALASQISEAWAKIPISYQFVFPLRVINHLDQEGEIASGIAFKNSPRNLVDAEGMMLPTTLSGLFGHSQDPDMASIVVDSKGLMEFTSPTEVPASVAIRKAKVVIQLGIVDDILSTTFVLSPPPKTGKYTSRVGLGFSSPLTIDLPIGFANVLRSVTLKPGAEEALLQRFARTGAVLTYDAKWNPSEKLPANATPQQIYEAQLEQHCARIATSAEWLFDAEHDESESVTTFVQTAIAFEALYGGGKDEPVVQTLANRLAYSLGKTPQHREYLRKRPTRTALTGHFRPPTRW